MRNLAGTACALAVALLPALSGGAAARTPAAAVASMGAANGYARDCTDTVFLDGRQDSRLRFVVWCGVQSGKVRFSIRRPDSGDAPGFEPRLTATGPGAGAPFRCRRVARTVKCRGRVDGPTVLRGTLSVAAATRCARVRVTSSEGIFGGAPYGCPHRRHERVPSDIGYMRGFRQSFGLDLDLHGDKAAVNRRIHRLIREWERGEPVARVTEVELGLPLSPRDQRELEYREEYLHVDSAAIERWAARNAPDTFAGWDLDHEHGGTFYIGFVGDQETQIAEFESQVRVLAPERIKPFPVAPTYSERQLLRYEEELLELPFKGKLLRLINSVGIDTLGNRVEVGTQHVSEVRRLLAQQFGTADPFNIIFEKPGVLL